MTGPVDDRDGAPPDETVTRGGYQLPPPPEGGRYAGPVDDPDRYELIGKGRTGGEGTTWQARYHGELASPLPLAVKQLRSPPDTEAARRRWLDQAALLRHVRAEHVVQVHEVFFGPPPHAAGEAEPDAAPAAYLVMEWVDGPTLRELCGGRPASRATVRTLLGHVEQASAALADLASTDRSAGNPSLHRDLKPSNCIVDDRRGLVLIDVSTLRLLDDGFDAAGWHTPQYTAPEVLAAPHRPRTAAADMYSLGALAAFCLTGESPGVEADNRAVLERAARRAGVADPGALAAHIMTALDPDPGRRPTDPAAWGHRLVRLGRSTPPRPAVLTAIAAVVLLAGGLVLFRPSGLLRGDDPADSRQAGPAASVSVAASAARPVPPGFAGRIDNPAEGAGVEQCAYLDGTATLPGGWTLILAMRNLSNGEPTRYSQTVFGFDEPAKLSRWRGAQYFGQNNDTVGQEYQVELVAVRLADAVQWRRGDPDEPGDTLAGSGVVLDSVRVDRIAGLVANACEGPP